MSLDDKSLSPHHTKDTSQRPLSERNYPVTAIISHKTNSHKETQTVVKLPKTEIEAKLLIKAN